jgi:dihydropteroate synthase
VGASLVNDVSGLRDPALAEVCAESGAGLVVMHTRAAPKQKALPSYADVVTDVRHFLRKQAEIALSRGVALEQIVLDPGPDFAKAPAQTVAVLRRLDALAIEGRPLLLPRRARTLSGRSPGGLPRRASRGRSLPLGRG